VSRYQFDKRIHIYIIGYMSKILSLDMMKLCKDTVNNQPSDTLFQNIINLVKNNFPGITHIAISVPINSDSDFKAHENSPAPRTPEAFTDFLLDTIHNAGYNVIIRATDCYGEGIYNFPFQPSSATHWINEATAHLTTHKAHLKNGDIAAYFPEFEGQNNGFGANVTDSWNAFYKGLITAISQWSIQNDISIESFTTINESEASSGWYSEDIVKAQDGFVVDYYPDANITDAATWIANLKTIIDNLYNKYGSASFSVFLQETADTRNPTNGSTQTSDSQMLADAFTQVIYPYLQSGQLNGINFWNLFDTPQEGIVTIDGDSVSLNAKGQALAKAFQSVDTITPTPPVIPPTTPPVPVIPGTSVSSEGILVKGNVYLHELSVNGIILGDIEVLH
jgi:hypothetical protein